MPHVPHLKAEVIIAAPHGVLGDNRADVWRARGAVPGPQQASVRGRQPYQASRRVSPEEEVEMRLPRAGRCSFQLGRPGGGALNGKIRPGRDFAWVAIVHGVFPP